MLKLFTFFLLLIGYILGVWCSHIPSEDRNESDGGVELIREKRDIFLDRIMKSIPFFHMSSPPNILEEEPRDLFSDDDDYDDDNDDDDADDEQLMTSTSSLPTHPSTTVGLNDVPTSVLTRATSTMPSTSTSAVLTATTAQTATPYSLNHTSIIVSMSKDSISTISTNDVSTSSSEMIKTTPAQSSTIIITPSISEVNSLSPDSFMNTPFTATTSNTIMNMTSYTYPLSASRVSTMQVSSIAPSSVSKMETTPLADDAEPVIKMMIMSGESPMRVQEYGGRLADERGFGDSLVKEEIAEDMDVKNIRFMYAGVLVPVMSGLAGALMITFGILAYRCMKRKKLKRVRYYGAKPASGLYRLDQIGLLSELSSDEE